MTRLEKIERDVEALDSADFARFRQWFADFEAARWDAQIEADAEAGQLDEIANRAIAAHANGKTRSL